MKKYVNFNDVAPQTLAKMAKGGVFLTSKFNGKVNTMTIGWGGITVYWGKPVFEAPVRYSRHSYGMINESGCFTVSVPLEDDDMAKALAYCGSHSGRNEDKISACGLEIADGEFVDAPIIKNCSLHFECKVLGKTEFSSDKLDTSVDERWYADKNYHTMFYGEIIGCYIIEK